MTKTLRLTAIILIWAIERYEDAKERFSPHWQAFLHEWCLFENEDGSARNHPTLDKIIIAMLAFNALLFVLLLAGLS